MGRAGRFGQPSAPATAAGATDHGALTGLGDDDHPQYETSAEAAAKVTAHSAASDPHADRAAAASALATHEADTTAIHGITDTSALETTSGSAAKVATHAGLADPHTGYLQESAAAAVATSGSAADLATGTLPIARIADGAVTLAKFANEAEATVLGRAAGAGTGVPVALSASQLRAVSAYTAATIPFTPVGAIAATDVQAAIAELLAERETMVLFSKQGVVAVTTEGDTPPPFRWYNRTGRTLTFLVASANATIGPSGSTMTVDVNVDGTTIMTGTKVVLPNNSGAASSVAQTTFSTATVDDGHYISVNVDTNGGGAVQNLMVQILLKG